MILFQRNGVLHFAPPVFGTKWGARPHFSPYAGMGRGKTSHAPARCMPIVSSRPIPWPIRSCRNSPAQGLRAPGISGSDGRGPWRGGGPEPCGHCGWPCAYGSRAPWNAGASWADRYEAWGTPPHLISSRLSRPNNSFQRNCGLLFPAPDRPRPVFPQKWVQ